MQQVDAILLDFSEAFDKAAYQSLAAKLFQSGIRSKTLAWIQSFLAERYQNVVLDGKTSSLSSFIMVQLVLYHVTALKSPRTPPIAQIIFSFWSFEISEDILRNQKIVVGVDTFSNQHFIYLAPFC